MQQRTCYQFDVHFLLQRNDRSRLGQSFSGMSDSFRVTFFHISTIDVERTGFCIVDQRFFCWLTQTESYHVCCHRLSILKPGDIQIIRNIRVAQSLTCVKPGWHPEKVSLQILFGTRTTQQMFEIQKEKNRVVKRGLTIDSPCLNVMANARLPR